MLYKGDEYDGFVNETANESDYKNIILKHLLLSIPSSVILLSLFSLILDSILKPS